MADQLLEAAQRETAEVLPKLRKDALFRRYELAQRVIKELMEIGGATTVDTVVVTSGALVPPSQNRPLQQRGHSRTGAVLAAAAAYLQSTGRRAQSPELLEQMRGRGIEFPGGAAVETLSSILSASKLFDNVRGQGYGLAEWAARPQAVPPNGSGTDQPPATGAPAE
jgi:hypothetical protein